MSSLKNEFTFITETPIHVPETDETLTSLASSTRQLSVENLIPHEVLIQPFKGYGRSQQSFVGFANHLVPENTPAYGTMAPQPPQAASQGPPTSYINVAKRFFFQQQIQGMMVYLGNNASREDNHRLQGVQLIDDIRKALSLPIGTFTVACVHYHKFRLAHKDNEYQWYDASCAALITACKIEDTLKKSKDIICAAHNLKLSPNDYLSPDDVTFDGPSKVIIGLERLMLEASGFDFRSFRPHETLMKLLKSGKFSKEVSRLAFTMIIDLHKTFAPLKQTTTTMAFACAELAIQLLESQTDDAIMQKLAKNYQKFTTGRDEIVETILDLLDLYTHFQKSSKVGPDFNVDIFIQIRIKYNQEVEQTAGLSRHTEWHESPKNGFKTNIKTPKTPITPASPSDVRANGASPATLSPRSSGSRGIGARGQDGTVRFMLDAEQARLEREVVDTYNKVEYEEYVEEVDEPIKPEQPRGHHRPAPGGGRNDHFYPSKRGRR